jgi:hypothetical protein
MTVQLYLATPASLLKCPLVVLALKGPCVEAPKGGLDVVGEVGEKGREGDGEVADVESGDGLR